MGSLEGVKPRYSYYGESKRGLCPLSKISSPLSFEGEGD